MDNLKVEHLGLGKGVHIDGFPDAVKVITLSGDKAQELSDMTLHLSDLDLSMDCLKLLSQHSDEQLHGNALWEISVIKVTKCFGNNNARKFNLKIEEVLKDDPEGQAVFNFFKHLRDKNIAHDDNPFTQSIPGAILNREGAKYKIAKIISLAVLGLVHGEENIGNLRLLIEKSKVFCQNRFDTITDELTVELEALPYKQLEEMKAIEYSKPEAESVYKNRPKIR